LTDVSQANVEIVRRSLEAFARGDFEAAFAEHGPDTEWCTAADEPDSQAYRGLGGLERLVGALGELWIDRFEDQMRFEGFRDHGDWVVVPWSARLRGRASGVLVEVRETYAVHVREGRIVRVQEYRREQEALEALAPHARSRRRWSTR
jgi:ketosteroid isomerase-like protein